MGYVREEEAMMATPVFQGILSVIGMVDIYLFITSILFDVIFKTSIILAMTKNDIVTVIVITQIIIYVIFYFIYSYKKKYVTIIEKFRLEDEKTRKTNRLRARLFILFSVLLLVVVFIIGVNHNKNTALQHPATARILSCGM